MTAGTPDIAPAYRTLAAADGVTYTMESVVQSGEFCIKMHKNDDSSIENDDSSIENDDSSIENDGSSIEK